MNDTATDFMARVARRHEAMSVEERVRAAAGMFEVARTIVEASIPVGIRAAERRYAVLKRLYGNEMPDAALRACVKYTA